MRLVSGSPGQHPRHQLTSLLGRRPGQHAARELVVLSDIGEGSFEKTQEDILGFKFDLGENETFQTACEHVDREATTCPLPMPARLLRCAPANFVRTSYSGSAR